VSFDLELTGRRALITAGTKGVGAAVVDGLHCLTNQDRGGAVRRLLRRDWLAALDDIRNWLIPEAA
jgi:NAD(P)-dependent dehydrogenase (short-subunit alcohol dehydrogenase family)